MSNESEKNKDLIPSPSDPKKLILGKTAELDLSGLTPEHRAEIQKQHASGMVRLNEKAQELGIEAHLLAKNMDDIAHISAKATEDNVAATITRTQEDTLGRTEIIMGNTDTAQKGKLTRSQAGLKDYTILYVVGAVIVVIILVALMN